MKVEIKVPPLGESVTEATISRIIQPSGALVQRDAEVLELETDKVNQVLYAPQAGKLELVVAVGQKVKVGEVVGSVDTSAEVKPAAVAAPKPVITPSVGAARIMPAESIAKKPPPPPPSAPKAAVSGERKRMSGLRRTIAQRLVEVKNTTAMLTSFNEADMTQIIEIRAREKDNF
ncbi:MAG: biotin/lipoyl-containing protein, partial [Patescibacteria group bacterium]